MVTHDKRIAEYADKVVNIHDGHIENVEIIGGKENEKIN